MIFFKKLFVAVLVTLSPLGFAQTTTTDQDPCPLYFSEVNACAMITWFDGPHLNQGHHRRGHHSMNMKKYSTLDILFYEQGDRTFTPLNFPFVKVYPWMIMHGMEHGSRPVQIQELPNGSYRVSKILFMKMNHGYWEMRFKVSERNNSSFNPRQDYDLKLKVNFHGASSNRHHN